MREAQGNGAIPNLALLLGFKAGQLTRWTQRPSGVLSWAAIGACRTVVNRIHRMKLVDLSSTDIKAFSAGNSCNDRLREDQGVFANDR